MTYMRPSELLALIKRERVLLLPCWSVEIAAAETGMSTKTRVQDRSVLMDQHGRQ